MSFWITFSSKSQQQRSNLVEKRAQAMMGSTALRVKETSLLAGDPTSTMGGVYIRDSL